MKLELKLTNDWLEATWYEEAITINDVEKQVGVDEDENPIIETAQEETITKIQVHCESFSGHAEHIAMLRAKAKEFNTELDEEMIAECVASFKMPTSEELAEQAKVQAIAEAQSYLDSTDWIKSKYIELVVMKKTMTEEEFNLKYEVELAKMDEARAIL